MLLKKDRKNTEELTHSKNPLTRKRAILRKMLNIGSTNETTGR